jgi:hypothetical protein
MLSPKISKLSHTAGIFEPIQKILMYNKNTWMSVTEVENILDKWMYING